jgi:hypothetical protein
MSATQKISQKTAINPYRFQKGESNPRFGKPRIAESGTPTQVLEVLFLKENNFKILPFAFTPSLDSRITLTISL